MPDYQPIHADHPVWMNGVKVNNLDFVTTGAGVLVTGIAGWQDGVEVRDVREPRPGFDGEDADSSYMSGRTITVSGRVAAASWAALQTAKQTLAVTFAPTAGEVLFKVPTAAASAPTTSYAAESMANYERSSVKVVEPIVFGEQAGFTQEWQVVLRASDPRIYSDTVTTDDGTISSYAGTVATPLKVSTVMSSADYGTQYDSTAALRALYSVGVTPSTISSYTAGTCQLVVDSSDRSAKLSLPHNLSRVTQYDPIFFFRLNEAAGTTADNAEGTAAYDGTIAGTPSLNQTGPLTDTKSILFDGTNDSVAITYSASLFPAAFTFEAWIKSSGTIEPTIDFTGGSGSAGWSINYGAEDVGVYLTATPTRKIAHARTSNTGWCHVVMTSGNGKIRLYLDGALVGVSTSTIVDPGSGTIYFGRNNSGSGFWAGNISSVGLYPFVCTADDVSEMYNSGSAVTLTGRGAGAVVDSVYEWPTLSAAKTITGQNALSGTVATTYRTARL